MLLDEGNNYASLHERKPALLRWELGSSDRPFILESAERSSSSAPAPNVLRARPWSDSKFQKNSVWNHLHPCPTMQPTHLSSLLSTMRGTARHATDVCPCALDGEHAAVAAHAKSQRHHFAPARGHHQQQTKRSSAPGITGGAFPVRHLHLSPSLPRAVRCVAILQFLTTPAALSDVVVVDGMRDR